MVLILECAGAGAPLSSRSRLDLSLFTFYLLPFTFLSIADGPKTRNPAKAGPHAYILLTSQVAHIRDYCITIEGSCNYFPPRII